MVPTLGYRISRGEGRKLSNRRKYKGECMLLRTLDKRRHNWDKMEEAELYPWEASDIHQHSSAYLVKLATLGKSIASFQISGYSFATTCAYDHTTLNTPVLVCSPKLSSVGPVQYLDGWPPGNHRCCRLSFFLLLNTLIVCCHDLVLPILHFFNPRTTTSHHGNHSSSVTF